MDDDAVRFLQWRSAGGGLRGRLESYLPRALIVLGAFGWLYSFHAPPSPLVPLHYASLIVACFGIGELVRRRLPAHSTLIVVATVAATIAACVTWWHLDEYETTWNGGDGLRNYETVSRSGVRKYSTTILPSGTTMRGPLSASGKNHGEWTYSDRSGAFVTSWYWYGDEVSEGEWHRRARE